MGKQGIMLELISFIDQALKYHELIKVKFNDFKTEKKDLSQEIETQLQCPLVGMIGHVAIFYREHPNPQKRKIAITNDIKTVRS